MAARYFADAFYFIALLSPKDRHHESAVALAEQVSGEFQTTDAVFLEVADAFRMPRDRQRVAAHLRNLWATRRINVREVDRPLMERGLTLYASRTDKEWSLTDCISFVVMQDEGISEALTGDRHFEQAGFRTLFPPE
jgi:hypothetical protein